MTRRQFAVSVGVACGLSPLGLPASSVAPSHGLAYLRLPLPNRRQEVRGWDLVERPVPVGSLLKPFVAVAAQRQRRFAPLPVIECRGSATRCWLPSGHGQVDLSTALAYSCNTYFLEIARLVPQPAMEATCHRYGLAVPRDPAPETLTGFGRGWPQRPDAVLGAYARLLADFDAPGTAEILTGLRRAAAHGTARAFADVAATRDAYAKTGTAPCAHEPRYGADGYAVVALPAASPRDLYLFALDGHTGRQTAEAAARFLAQSGKTESAA